MEFSRDRGVAVTYLDDGNQDGVGSQLLRIYGIYAIARSLKVPYVHTPVAHLGYHGLAALENNAPSADLLEKCNRVFHIASDLDVPETRVTHEMTDADPASILRIQDAASAAGEFHLVRILYPFPMTDSDPELYRGLDAISPFHSCRSDVFRLAIHVRRGELFAVHSDWMLPNSYYVRCVLNFQRVLKRLDIPFVCELYTEVASQSFEVTPRHHGILQRISDTVTFDPAMNHLEDFDEIPHLQRYVNFDPVESMERMTTADALIISHSSFSYLPAILNSNRVVVYHPYWRARMKDWLVSDDDGALPEAELLRRLESWKRAGAAASGATRRGGVAAMESAPSDGEIASLLQPFAEQSASIRSIVAFGCASAPPTGAAVFGVGEGNDHSGTVVGTELAPPDRSGAERESTLDSVARRVREMFRAVPGNDLLLVPANVLTDTIVEHGNHLGFLAIAVLTPQGGADAGRLRRSLFDRGLVCIGAVSLGARQALCFLASDAVHSFDRLDVESRGHVTMSTLVEGAGFANQLWRYACVKLYALRHGLTPAVPEWQGNQLYGLRDESCAGFDFPALGYPGFADNDREFWDEEYPPVDVDLRGFFQEIPECWREHRSLLRRLFQLSPENVQAIDSWRDAVTDGGRRTLVAISVRRGDYRKLQSLPEFRFVPEEWYLDWLRAIWPTLRDPLLFVTTDEPDTVMPHFRGFETTSTPHGSLAQHVRDFEVLRRADYLAICNSSYPRMAAILAPPSQQCFIPSFTTQAFEPYEPWIDPAFWARFGSFPPDSYVPIDGMDGKPAAERICASGWGVPETSGVRAAEPTAVVRLCVDLPAGSRLNLVMRLEGRGRDSRVRICSDSGAETEVALGSGSSKVAVLPCVVDAERMVTARLSSMGGAFSGRSPWMLLGVLYFQTPSAGHA
jgi:hypothetical protein